MNKLVVIYEGIAFCDSIPCSNWMSTETTCEGCPIDKLLLSMSKYQAAKAGVVL